MASTKTISVFIIEDNELTRVAIRSVLERVSQFQVVGEADDGESALVQIAELKPQVVLADIGLPKLDGIGATKWIKISYPEIRVVMLTSHDNDRDIFNSFDAGADGYVIKDAFSNRLELAIKSVSEGTTWLDPAIAQRVLSVAASNFRALSSGMAPSLLPEPLSEEERSVLTELAEDESACKDGVCSIDPTFLQKLHRFARSPEL